MAHPLVDTVYYVDGQSLFYEEICASNSGVMPPRRDGPVPGTTPNPTPTAAFIDTNPLGTNIFWDLPWVSYWRCMAFRAGRENTRVGVFSSSPKDWGVVYSMSPRNDGRTMVFVCNIGPSGWWVESQSLNAAGTATAGRTANPFIQGNATEFQFVFETVPSTATASGRQVIADSIGFVRRGRVFPVAEYKASFAWSTWRALSPGMNIYVVLA